MAETEFGLNNALAVQRWSEGLTYESEVGAYFNKFEGRGKDSLIVVQDELAKGAGEKVTVGLKMKLTENGIEGDAVIEGDAAGEEAMDFFSDAVYIDQRRKGVVTKGKMTEQRVPYALRKEAHDSLNTWFMEDRDQQYFIYLSGARGINTDFHVATNWTGRANNAIQVPNAANIIYAGDATAKLDIESSDVMSLLLVERLVAKAETQDPMIQPFMVDGEKKYVLLMHTWQAFQLRTGTSENDWLAIQKAAQRGDSARFYKNSLGEYADVVLHKHRSVIRFSDYGATTNLPAARALFLGAQAGICAYGRGFDGAGDRRYSWNEEKADRGNKLAVTAGLIFGVKKARYDSKDFGVIAVDSYCKDPNS